MASIVGLLAIAAGGLVTLMRPAALAVPRTLALRVRHGVTGGAFRA